MIIKTRRTIKIYRISISRKSVACPVCGQLSRRHSISKRLLKEIGVCGPTLLQVTVSRHYCENCRKHFSAPMGHIAVPSARFTNRVRRAATDLVVKQGLTLEKASVVLRSKYHVHVPPTTLHDWVLEALVA